ncbi:hypothetical protein NG99_26665 [Erwinia typographi]|uniref:Sialate O-acetylesterase domain-containing protein n=2 Tax=Erwinia typographi TaxID=371042 RepID=A0A0A3YH93_9GAMM|nr:hypothetical protein NG99_26665 [Erwinia typographi]
MNLQEGSEPGTLNDYVIFAEPVLATPTVYSEIKSWHEETRSISADVSGQVSVVTVAVQESQEHAQSSLAGAEAALSSAAQAKSSEDAARLESESAASAASSAQNYADTAKSAVTTANVYPDVATGLAATSSGQSFSVAQGTSANSAVIIYLNSNGVAQAIAEVAGTARINLIYNTAEYARQFNDNLADSMASQVAYTDDAATTTALLADSQLRILLGMDHDERRLNIYGRPATTVDDLNNASGDRWSSEDDAEVILLADSAGRKLLNLNIGERRLYAFGSPVGDISEIELPEMADLPSYGQSLSISYLGSPGLSTPTTNTYIFTGNMKTYNQTLSSLSLLSASTSIEYHEKSMMHELNRVVTDSGQYWLVSASGVEGYSMAQLEPGTAPWTQFMARIDKARELSNGLGRQYGMVALTFFQGEADAFLGSSYDYYREKMRLIQSSTAVKALSVSGQPGDIPMMIYQMASHGRYAGTTENPSYEIPLAQLDEAIDNPLIQMITPMYIFPYTDGVHLINHGYRWLGCYRAKAVKHWIQTGTPWKPVYPIAVYKSGPSTIVADFHTMPGRRLRFSTDIVTQATDGMNGFELWGESESGERTRLAISAVQIIGRRKVKVTASDSFTTFSKIYLAYAFTPENRGDNDGSGRYPSWNSGPTTGVRGNLCDDDDATTDLLDANGTPYPLQNYCAIFFKEAI